MQSEHKNDSIQLPTRYQCYTFAKRHLRRTSRPEVFPVGVSNPKTLKQLKGGSQGNRIYSINGISTTIASQAGGQGAKTGLYAMRWQRTDKGKKIRKESQKNGIDYTPFSGGCRECIPVEGKPVGSLTAQTMAKDSLIGNKTQIRRLTPKEAERLQGFPEDWTKYGDDNKEISDTQRYKMLGNAVTVNVIEAIMDKLTR